MGEPVAIIGTGCRFPGSASSPSKLWDLLKEPQDLRRKIPENRFNPVGLYHPDSNHHGTSNVQHSYTLDEDHRHFDAQFFGIKPSEAGSMDPQQRLLLEVVYEGLEAAGQRIEDLQGSQTAVYVGLMCGEFGDMLMQHPDELPTYTATGTARSIMANRVSYVFDWHGLCMTIDTACSSSLVALHHAVQTLRLGESRVAVAAGSNLCLGPEPYIAESKLKMLSPNGRSRMWDADADGYARGDGVAAVVVKLLKDAVADGDSIECVIRGTAVNQDGRTKGITMPSSEAQEELIRAAYSRAGLDITKASDRPQYFEAHGTGTPTGDPLEAAAIHQAFFKDAHLHGSKYPPLYVGSIKSIVGHTEGTAGLAGIIKASLAIRRGKIPPNLWFKRLNPAIEPYYGNLQVANNITDWPVEPETTVRRASVNSFGFGGTNAHAILENYGYPEVRKQLDCAPASFVPLTLSAHTEAALLGQLSQYIQYVKAGGHELDTRALAHTLNSRRSRLNYRYAITPSQDQGLLETLEEHKALMEDKKASVGNKAFKPESAHILGVFTGQGAQHAGMMAELYSKSPMVRDRISRFDTRLSHLPESLRPSWSLKEELLRSKQTSRIGEASLAQPLSTVIQLILVDILRAAGLQFSAVVGHSSGEIAACYAAGYVSATDAVCIAYLRGLACSSTTNKPGRMVAIGTSFDDATDLCSLPDFEGRICIAAVNSSSSLTLSGDMEAVEEAKTIFDDEQKFARILTVDKAYHSHHMLQFAEPYVDCLSQCNISIQRPPEGSPFWVSSVDGKIFRKPSPDLSAGYWVRNMTQPVQFHQAVSIASLELGSIDMGIEIGPHPALAGPVKQTLQEILNEDIPYTGMLRRGGDSVEALATGFAQVWSTVGQGATIDFSKLEQYLSQAEPPPMLKDLPTYPWVHERLFWDEPRASKVRRSRNHPPNQLLGNRDTTDPGQQFRWHNILTPSEISWLSDHRIQGQRVFPAAGYIATATEAALQVAKSQDNEVTLVELQDIIIGSALSFDDDSSKVEILFTLTELDHIRHQQTNTSSLSARFHYFSAPGKEVGPMLLHAEGRLIIHYGAASKDTLPPRPKRDSSFIDMDQNRCYDSLSSLGYGYTGPFRALSSLKRKLGAVTGVVLRLEDEEPQLAAHPATLDVAMQSVMLAASWPGDGRLWSLHIPTRIANVMVNPKLCLSESPSKAPYYTFDTTLSDQQDRGITGNFSIYTASGSHALMRMEGMRAVPLEGATPENDRRLFTKVVWQTAAPDAAAVVRGERASHRDYQLAELLERVAHFYMKRLDEAFPEFDRARSNGPWANMLGYAHHVVEIVAQGKHVCARTDWVNDNEETIEAEMQEFPENMDVRVMRIIGQNIIGVVRGNIVSMLEHLRVDSTLDDYYSQAMGTHYAEYLGRLAKQLAFRDPHLNFLEVGAGTGGATKSILREIGWSYGSYTFTDISTGFFEAAQDNFSDHRAKLRFSTLDIEKDIEAQGYKPHSYDVIVASFVLHATHNLKNTVTRVRQLLKPGGYLLLLEITNLSQARLGFIFGSLPGWWLAEEPHRRYTPLIGKSQWEQLLLETGFAGFDTVTPDLDPLPFPVSAIVSQAVDSSVSFLRDPLCCSPEMQASHESPRKLLIVGGGLVAAVSRLSRMMKSFLSGYFTHGIAQVLTLEELLPSSFDSSTTVLCLADLDSPFFYNLSEKSINGLKTLFNNATNLLWVTKQARDNNPLHAMSIGFGRSMQMEMPHVRTQYLDLDTIKSGTALTIAEALVRFDSPLVEANKGDILWPEETEISLVSDQEFIHRIVDDTAKNDRYNSMRREITRSLEIGHDSPVRISSGQGEHRLLVQTDGEFLGTNVQLSTRVVTRLSTLSPVKFDETTNLQLIIGRTFEDGRKVACLSEDLATLLSIPDGLVAECGEDSPQFFATLCQVIKAGAMVRKTLGCLVLVEPEEALAAAVQAHASNKETSPVYISTDPGKTGPHYHYIHPTASMSELDQAIPRGSSTIILGRSSGLTESRIKAWARSRQVNITDWEAEQASWTGSVSASSLRSMLETSINIAKKQLPSATFGPLSLKSLADLPSTRVSGHVTPLLNWDQVTAPVNVEPVDRYPMLRSDRTYWLVGMSKSLGLSLCGWMIDHGAKYVAISSRSPIVDRSALEAFAKKGAVVKVLPCDVADKKSLVATYTEIQRSMAPIAGVANGAMVLRDSILDGMTLEKMNKVLEPKVIGSLNLHELFRTDSLDFLVFLSSAVATTGNAGQSNYSVANMFMHGLAAQRRKNGLAASVIVIGVILGVGYITRETSQSLQDNLLKSGHTWMSEQDFHTLFAEAIRDGSGSAPYQSEIISGLKHTRPGEEHRPPWASIRRFSHLVLQEESTGVSNSAAEGNISLKDQFQEARSPEEIYEIFRDALCDHVAAMLQMEGASSKSDILQHTAETLGIDSLNAVDLRTWFMKEAKVDVPVLRILGGSTLADILDFAFEILSVDVAPAKSTDYKPPASTKPKTTDPTPVKPPPQKSMANSGPSSALPSQPPQLSLEPAQRTIDQATRTPAPPSRLAPPESPVSEAISNMPTPEFFPRSESSFSDSFSAVDGSSSSEPEIIAREDAQKSDTSQALRSEKLSHGQSRFWFLQSYIEDPTAFNITCLLQIRGNLDVSRLECAFAQVGSRHQALRTAITVGKDGLPEQRVLKQSTLRVEHGSWVTNEDVDARFDELKRHVYDLARGEVMSVVLLSPQQQHAATQRYYLLVGYHHINMDGVSLEIILRELEAVYSGQPLHGQPFQYPDHAARELQKRSAGKWDSQLKYWRGRLSNLPEAFPILPFGETGMRQTMRTYGQVKASLPIDAATKALIRGACRSYKVSPHHFYTAAYHTLLSRWANVKEVCIGSSYAGRHDAHLQTSVGLYLNLLTLRLPYNANTTFVLAMKTAKRCSTEGIMNSDVPFDMVLDELMLERNPSFSPVFQTYFNYRPDTDEKRAFGQDCELFGERYESGKTPYDVILDVYDGTHEDSRVELSLQKYLYSQAAVDVLMRSFGSLVKSFAKNPKQRLGSAPLYDESELRQLSKLGQGDVIPSTWAPTLIHRVFDMCHQHGSKAAIHHRVGQILTFKDMAERVDRLYEALSDANVPAGSSVGVHVQASADWVCSLLAILKYGAIYVPLDSRYGLPRLRAIVDDCRPAAIFVDKGTEAVAEQIMASGDGRQITALNTSSIEGTARAPTPVLTTPGAVAAILYTSGSTGVPKGIPLSHQGLRNNVEDSTRLFSVLPSDMMLQQTAFSFDFSLWQIFLVLANGGTLVIAPEDLRRDPSGIVDLIHKTGVTITGATPSEYSSWVRYGARDSLRGSAWTRAVCGGEPVRGALVQEFRELGKKDLDVHNIYGPTEVTVFATTAKVNYLSEAHGIVPAGRVIPNYTVTILGDDGQVQPPGVVGEVVIGGIGVASEYINKSEETRRRFHSKITALEAIEVPQTQFHMTGDQGWLSNDGLLYLRGRIADDTQVKLRGQRLDLQDIEQAIVDASSGAVLEANVAAPNDAQGASFLVAQVILRDHESDVALSQLVSSLPLPRYMRPSAIFALDKFPTTDHGKRDRRALAEMVVSRLHEDKPHEGGMARGGELNPAQTRILSIWNDVVPEQSIRLHSITADSDFFMIGGNSISLVEVRNRMQRDLGVSVELVSLFEASSLDGMASLINQQKHTALGNEDSRIDWDSETQLNMNEDWGHSIRVSRSYHGLETDRTAIVILTGATGFLGRALLRRLVADPAVQRVHCIAVRRPEKLASFKDSPKVQVHPGDLAEPRLGMSEETARQVFVESNVIIHNGADVSFLKTYQSLRQANLESTRELIKLSLKHVDGGHDFHYVSTAGVTWLSGQREFPEASARALQPPDDGSFGYAASKWASERILEQAAASYELPVSIYRPTNITGEDLSDQDIVHSIVRFSRVTKKVPDTSGVWDGFINFVSLDQCTEDIASGVLAGPPARQVRYLHVVGPEDVHIGELKSYMERKDDSNVLYDEVGLAEWVAQAERAGLNGLTAAYLRKLAGEEKPALLTRLLRKDRTGNHVMA